MLLNEREERHNTVLQAAKLIMSAARTAPKARGVDLIEIAVVEGDDLKRLSDATHQMYERTGRPVYQRDAANILQGEAVLLIGTRRQVMGLNCAHCGYATCGEKPEKCALCYQHYRCRNSHWVGLRYRRRPPYRYARVVFSRYGSDACRFSPRMH